MKRKCGSGFTLVELLTVMGIIAILMAILLPAIATSREKGRIAYCSNNLSQLGKAIVSYADEHKDWLPLATSNEVDSAWDLSLLPYVGDAADLFICPSDPYLAGADAPRSYSANAADSGQAYRFPFGTYSVEDSQARMGDLDYNKGDIILIGEWPGESEANRGLIGWFGFSALNRDNRCGRVHQKNEGGNYLMGSLAVQYMKRNDSRLNTAPNVAGNLWALVTE